MDAVDPSDLAGTVAAGRAALAPVLASPAPRLRTHRIIATGHGTFDSAWLWPCARPSASAPAPSRT